MIMKKVNLEVIIVEIPIALSNGGESSYIVWNLGMAFNSSFRKCRRFSYGFLSTESKVSY
ncbi:hypothetical protein C5167_003213 [Papaver somniferum]|uniref:Uncharacterized protein n=1 Tax=Papaver somniferum TaxID=3469 RepID=A0A4Y7L1Z9_PAPSO|nr:hypothetical protein C5167_003213 [Papaver somniferum]